jgi:small subunit ribosomal protein S21
MMQRHSQSISSAIFFKSPCQVSVRVNTTEDFEKAIRAFNRKVQRSGILSEVRARRFHEKPSIKKKQKRVRAYKRRQRTQKRQYKCS